MKQTNEMIAALKKVVDHLCDTICALLNQVISGITRRQRSMEHILQFIKSISTVHTLPASRFSLHFFSASWALRLGRKP